LQILCLRFVFLLYFCSNKIILLDRIVVSLHYQKKISTKYSNLFLYRHVLTTWFYPNKSTPIANMSINLQPRALESCSLLKAYKKNKNHKLFSPFDFAFTMKCFLFRPIKGIKWNLNKEKLNFELDRNICYFVKTDNDRFMQCQPWAVEVYSEMFFCSLTNRIQHTNEF